MTFREALQARDEELWAGDEGYYSDEPAIDEGDIEDYLYEKEKEEELIRKMERT